MYCKGNQGVDISILRKRGLDGGGGGAGVSTMSNRSKSRIVVFNKNKSSLFPFLSQMHQCLQ